MKVFLSTLLIIALGVAIIYAISTATKNSVISIIARDNMAMKPLKIKLNHINCAKCAMLIKTKKDTAEVVATDGRTWFFDDPGCMVLWLEDKSFKDNAKIWVYTMDTNRWVDARKAHYGMTDKTVMHYGFGARENGSSSTIDFEQMRLRMLKGENLTDPNIRKKLLGI